MASYEFGKSTAVVFMKKNLKKNLTCLDIGPCDGIWYYLLGDYFRMDACEVFSPYIEKYKLVDIYDHVFNHDVRDFKYCYYDVVIAGDVLEHLSVEDAQKVIDYAVNHSGGILVAVPYNLDQDAINNNENEIHIQNDLTDAIFQERYPGFQEVYRNGLYGYYWKSGEYVNKIVKKGQNND